MVSRGGNVEVRLAQGCSRLFTGLNGVGSLSNDLHGAFSLIVSALPTEIVGYRVENGGGATVELVGR